MARREQSLEGTSRVWARPQLFDRAEAQAQTPTFLVGIQSNGAGGCSSSSTSPLGRSGSRSALTSGVPAELAAATARRRQVRSIHNVIDHCYDPF